MCMCMYVFSLFSSSPTDQTPPKNVWEWKFIPNISRVCGMCVYTFHQENVNCGNIFFFGWHVLKGGKSTRIHFLFTYFFFACCTFWLYAEKGWKCWKKKDESEFFCYDILSYCIGVPMKRVSWLCWDLCILICVFVYIQNKTNRGTEEK